MSRHLPVVSGREAARAFEKLGFVVLPNRGKGSHMVMHKAGTPVLLTVPVHRPLKRGTLRSLIREAGITVDRFRELL